MGCGSSSLKGDLNASTIGTAEAEPRPQPVTEIKHNFNSIDYDAEGSGGRRNTTYAPHETSRQPSTAIPPGSSSQQDRPVSRSDPRVGLPTGLSTQLPSATEQTNPSTTLEPPSQAPVFSNTIEGNRLEPYHSLSEQPGQTSTNTKNATMSDRTNSAGSTSDQTERKKSWYQKFQEKKRGPGTSSMSDEDLQKYTGMDRAQLEKYTANTPGVGGNQPAGKIDQGSASGLGGVAAAEGYGGWGQGASKTPGGFAKIEK